MTELQAIRDDPPTEVKVVSWIVIILSGILVVLFLGHFAGGSKDLPVDSYELLTAVIKISAAFGMLRGSALARIIFLWSYGICCLVGDAIAYSPNWVSDGIIVIYVFNALLFFVYVLLLTRPDANVWFGSRVAGFSAVQKMLRHNFRGWHYVGGLLFVAATAIFGFFGYHFYLDVRTLTYRPLDAEILFVNIRLPENTVVVETDSKGQRRSVNQIVTYDPEVRYRYRLNGRTFESGRFSTFGSVMGISAAEARRLYVPGGHAQCWVSSDGKTSVLQRGFSTYYFFAFFNLLLIVFARLLWRSA